MFGIGWGELALIFVLILILFGPKQAQGIFKAFGKGIKEFKDAMTTIKVDDNSARPADFQQPPPHKEERAQTQNDTKNQQNSAIKASDDTSTKKEQDA